MIWSTSRRLAGVCICYSGKYIDYITLRKKCYKLIFRLMTSAGWNDVLESLMVTPPDCDMHFKNQTNGDCGHPLLAITYFTSFIIISYMIVINMYIAIILENFNQAHQEEEIGIVEDDLEMFYIRWSKYASSSNFLLFFIHFIYVFIFLLLYFCFYFLFLFFVFVLLFYRMDLVYDPFHCCGPKLDLDDD